MEEILLDFDIIKNTNDENPNKKKFNKIIIFAVIIAIIFLAFSKTGDKETKTIENDYSDFDFVSYKQELTEETEAALSKIKGAGNVEVILSFESRGKNVIARNSQSKTQKDLGDIEQKEVKENTDNVVVYGQGENETPYVTEEKLPLPTGILIIAKGASSENVKMELYEAVKALYGIDSHRIKVTVAGK